MINQLPNFARMAMLATCQAIMVSRPPDVIIGDEADPYVHRWWVGGPHGLEPNAYIHIFLRSDTDIALHDHRYRNVSIILDGECHEYFHTSPLRIIDGKYATQSAYRTAGDIVEREAATPHRIELIDGKPMVTIFFTGQHERDWGFHHVDGWLGWRQFNAKYKADRPDGTYGKNGI